MRTASRVYLIFFLLAVLMPREHLRANPCDYQLSQTPLSAIIDMALALWASSEQITTMTEHDCLYVLGALFSIQHQCTNLARNSAVHPDNFRYLSSVVQKIQQHFRATTMPAGYQEMLESALTSVVATCTALMTAQ